MADTLGVTLSHADVERRRTGTAEPRPTLVLALECSRPGALSARWCLSGLAAVHLGRGSERKSERSASELAIRVPDRWMSSRHARIENSFGRWVLVDTDSKNGSVVNGQTTRRAVLADGDLIELGHTVFVFLERLAMHDDDPLDIDLIDHAAETIALPGMATLLPEYARELARLREVATADIAVLIEGESGTGKELLARAVHGLSGRPGAFVAVNCGALPPNLVESELFGYKRGAFSGAQTDHTGLVRSADGGTLFLDEIGDLPPASQAALLRVLQEREVMPVGGTRPVPVDLRVVAATHRDLDDMIAGAQFRHDLFARLAGFRIEVPSLSERRTDLGLVIGLLHHRIFGGAVPHPGFDVEAVRLLLRYPWPLNVRELEQSLNTAAVLAKAGEVTPDHLPETVRLGRAPGAPRPLVLSEADQKQRDELLAMMRTHQGNISAIARAMGKDRKQIQRWVKRFAIEPSDYR